jgi:hypothetical protein
MAVTTIVSTRVKPAWAEIGRPGRNLKKPLMPDLNSKTTAVIENTY